MEVYIPWNNTWLDLPPLPDLGDGGGRMEKTRIMSMTDSSNGLALYLLGASRTEMNTGWTTSTDIVWTLVWDMGSKTYSWTHGPTQVPPLGR